MTKRKIFFGIIWGLGIVCLLFLLCFIINVYMTCVGEKASLDDMKNYNADCIVVLGAGILAEDVPSHVLEDRLIVAYELYQKGAAKKIIVSGDHGQVDYDEVNAMKNYLIRKGVPSEDIFMDHAGFSTYDTMYRARDIFCAKNIVIVTQNFHIDRALYIANALQMDAIGVSADLRTYAKQDYFEMREYAARVKDFFLCIFQPEPTYLGESIPVSGNGDITNDKTIMQ